MSVSLIWGGLVCSRFLSSSGWGALGAGAGATAGGTSWSLDGAALLMPHWTTARVSDATCEDERDISMLRIEAAHVVVVIDSLIS